jgi:integrase/recombinase XerD
MKQVKEDVKRQEVFISRYRNKIDEETIQIIENYLDDKKVVNRSSRTIYSYKCFLYSFFAKTGKPFRAYTHEDILNWKNKYKETRQPRTLAFALSILSGIFKWGLSEEYIDIFPMKKSWNPKLKKLTPKPLNTDDEAKFRVESENMTLRDRALARFILDTGARRSEAVSLNAKDLNIRMGNALILGKRNKWRRLHFTDECGFLLETLLGKDPQGNMPVFRNRFGGRLSDRSVHRVIKTIGVKAGIKRKIHPHIIRHTFATRLLRNGASLKNVSDALGHEELETTKIYADNELEKKRMIYFQCMGSM